MKIYRIILVVLIPLFLGSYKNTGRITIKGKLLGKITNKVEYTIPDNEIYNWVMTDSVKVDSLGNFQIVITSDKPTFVKLKVSLQSQGMLIVEPGKSYNVLFDLNKEKDYFLVLEGNEIAQNIYNKFNAPLDPDLIQLDARNYFKDTSALSIKEKISKKKMNDITLFKELFDNEKISKVFLQLIEADRECYYTALQANIAWLKQYRATLTKGQFPNDMKNLWIETFQNPIFEKENISQSPWFYTYCINYLYFKEFINNDINTDKSKELVKNGHYNTYCISEAKKYLPKQLQESYIADNIYLKSLYKEYELEFIAIFDQFKNDYPKSNYTKYLMPEINENLRFHKIAESEFNEKVKFVDDYQNIKDLNGVGKLLKGKKVYVDVWATWCHSCREEFAYKEELNKLLESKGITMLYISIDKDEKDKQWKDLIKFYNLEGYHVRVNENLNSDLRNIFNQNGSIYIPWYLIFDKNGKIIKDHAKSPKEMKELEKELNEN